MNWDYVAGFFDGEGSFMLTTDRAGERKSINVQIQIGQNDRDLLVTINDFLFAHGICGGVYTQRENRPNAITRQEFYTLRICNRINAQLMLAKLAPRLNHNIKRHYAEDLARFLQIYPAMERGKNPLNRQLIKWTRGQQKFSLRARAMC